jgi:succinate dehydrogenase / fumarate reductase, membrane anchor subunit
MVTSVTSFGRSGLSDWLLQRFTALVLLTYTLCVGSFLLLQSPVDYAAWRDYMAHPAMRVFSSMALLSLVVHAWIGLWSVSTDYLTVRTLGPRATALRVLFQGGYAAVLFAYLIWGFRILWSN